MDMRILLLDVVTLVCSIMDISWCTRYRAVNRVTASSPLRHGHQDSKWGTVDPKTLGWVYRCPMTPDKVALQTAIKNGLITDFAIVC